ncbi:actin filament-associated protein 1-like 1 isoform X3 [Acanthopagrus latus]|uniref:actin filament-associated protein 1-like 1 isoform X3 n=1 Tax=Acanthopagrus latus TaxID=8177 RepID=UPI00187CA897|nr:actin filament-associated protein 1-like 1 isoform X3 [Acanthopagrus latus]XP_036933970.1 actin filament-associated protein 1-like 1 isoform X3 [Acanthopagrus latus]XP_036933971.1 actin filament-associated protein 1-like 1 isoform X3 [Acanthopagrus latus]XP_036933972.1 actin filament-associated protein 1-like 1 isoform X3 [Acanthopagrus latus]XP_036933973.1 actin filament-associated protein 1-like 1 isoform X3 [Acanthopagrus latus]
MDTKGTKSMEVLVNELGVLLKMLDQENLSSSTQEKKTSVWKLLQQIQPPVSGTDYIYMNSSVYRNGTSFVESLFETFDCDIGDLKDVTDDLKEEKNTQADTLKQQNCADSPAPRSADSPPPLPTTPPPEEYYEEAVPLSPGKLPEYIITRVRPSPPNSIEDGYEDAENNYPTTCINTHRKNSYNDSDALSSSYESYEEDEEERSPGVRLTHQWPSDESSMPPARDCRICAFLLRKKRFGQWAKQLTVIRENRLQCYKSSKDTCPYVDLLLPQCTVVYAPKDSKRKHHELRFTLPNGDALVLAVQSKEQAHRWLRVVREVSGQSAGPEESASPIIPRKTELDKRLSAERNTSDSDSVGVSTAENSRENGKVKRGAFAAGRKITRIISFSKKKPPRPGDPRVSYSDPRQGYLSLLVNQVWREQWCCVCRGSLHVYHDKGDPRTCFPSLPLHGCEVVPGLGPKHPFAFRILRNSMEVAALEASSSEELGRWLGVLLAETGSATDPESLHYDYVDVETIANIRDAARHSFLWATSSSSTSTDSRTYDEVPNEDMQSGENRRQQSGNQGKRRSSFSSSDSDRTKPAVSLKRTGSNANQYGRYGKTRAEEDAKRYQKEKEELERERDGIRNALVTLRQEKRELKEELKTASERRKSSLSKRVSELEEACRAKEAERVDLELRLTQVQENLKKSLAGGSLGAPVEAKPPVKASSKKTQNIYSESLPVNCALEMRRRPPSVYASSSGTVMQKAKEWESKKGT